MMRKTSSGVIRIMTKKPPKAHKGPKKADGRGAKVVQNGGKGGLPVPVQAEIPGKSLAPIKEMEPSTGRRGKPHEPTLASRNLVVLGCATGLTQEDIARRIGIAEQTLRTHYAEELADGGKKLLLSIAGNLATIAQSATHPRAVTAAIFWLKTRAGFRDVSLPGDGGGQGKSERVSFTINIGASAPKPGDDAKVVNG